MPDGRLVVPQAGNIKAVAVTGTETTLFSDLKHISDQVDACGGKYLVFRQIGRSSIASANLWRTNLDGTNLKQLTSGLNEQMPTCTREGDWVYYIDSGDNKHVKRVSIEGGTPETVVKQSIGTFALSPDGKEIASLDVREFDHKLILRRDSTETQKMMYHDIDQRALREEFLYTPDGKAIVYKVRDKGVENLWEQPLDGGAFHQLTHFTKDQILRVVYSRDGAKVAIERGETESDAVLIHDSGM